MIGVLFAPALDDIATFLRRRIREIERQGAAPPRSRAR
jgi:hypothetical protein